MSPKMCGQLPVNQNENSNLYLPIYYCVAIGVCFCTVYPKMMLFAFSDFQIKNYLFYLHNTR